MTIDHVECPQCGYRKIGDPSRDDTPSPSSQNQTTTTSVEERVRVLDLEIQRLNEERARLLRERNEHESIVRKTLPPEILSQIFRFVCPPIDFSARHFDTSEALVRINTPALPDLTNWELNGPYVPVILASVCSYWRQVAQSTPELWTSIALEVRERTAVSHARLLQLYITRSKNLPVSIELDLRKEQKVKYTELPSDRVSRLEKALRPVANVLFHRKAIGRISTLRLNSPPCDWLTSIPLLSQLENLSLGWPFRFCTRPTGSQELDLSGLGLLTHFSLCRELKVVLPWSQITTLKLQYLPIATCVDILFQCENVRRCRVRHIYSDNLVSSSPGPLETGSMVTLKHLRFLEWPPLANPVMRAFFSRLNLPSLRRLRWEDNVGLEGLGPINLALQFFSRLPASMKTLELIGEAFGTVTGQQNQILVHHLLGSIPQLETLILNCIRSAGALKAILEALGSNDLDGQAVLPNLNVLDFRGIQKCRLLPSVELRAQIVSMLRARYLRSNSGLIIKLEEVHAWSNEQKEDMREMVRMEYKIELWEKGAKVGWLRHLD